MRKRTAFFGPMIVAFSLLCLVLLIPTSLLEKVIPNSMVKRASYGFQSNMIKGMLIQDKMLKSPNYLPIYGSSELMRIDPFHPTNYFEVNPIGVSKAAPNGLTPFLVGKAGSEDLVHFLNFATKKNLMENKKVVFILSPQWFTPKGDPFTYNFSILQAYEYAMHPQLSPKLQAAGAKRLLHFSKVKQDSVLKYLLEGQIYKDPKHQLLAHILRPVGDVILSALEKRDFVFTYFEPLSFKYKLTPDPALTKNVEWEQLIDNAAKVAKSKSNNNQFGIDNADYNRVYKNKLKSYKGKKRDLSYSNSPEYADLQLVLETLKEAHVKALFISVPVNGYWYDYVDVSKKGREIYYKKVKAQVEMAGFQFADYSNHEYDKTFLKDPSHLGWEGWAYVDQAIYEFWNNQPIKPQSATP